MNKILIVGERSTSLSGYAYADSFVEILQNYGYQVRSFDCTRVETAFGVLSRFRLNRISASIFSYLINQRFEELCTSFEPDFCFVLKGDTILPKTLSRLKKRLKTRFILFYPDNPFLFTNGNSNPGVVESLALYDVVLSWSLALMPILTSLGVRHVCYFPFGYDARFFEHFLPKEPLYDVGFIGTADDERFELLSQIVKRLPLLKIGVWGNRWDEYKDQDEILYERYCGSAEYKQQMVDRLRACKIVLNPLRLQNYTAHNMRSLEAAAAEVFQLATYSHEHADILFTENESIAMYKDVDDLERKINWYLDHPEERIKMAAEAKKRVEIYSLQKMLKLFFDRGGCFCSPLL
ncbi:glycosyltransferase [Candidatus Dependentiae bacterium]|nr:glycosyltransferase [Candidatus Dependentiae bacterium]